MRFLLDENIALDVAQWIRREHAQHEVEHVLELGADSQDDTVIFGIAQEKSAVVVTYDADFGDRRSFASRSHCGIIRLRCVPSDSETTREVLARVFGEIRGLDLTGRLLIADRHRTRIV